MSTAYCQPERRRYRPNCCVWLLQCKALPTRFSNELTNSSTVVVTASSSQPCSSLEQWINSPVHMVVIDDHTGCSIAANVSDQLILHIMPNSSCTSHLEHQSAVRLQGRLAESFEAFSKLSLRLYRGPDAVPQAKSGTKLLQAGATPQVPMPEPGQMLMQQLKSLWQLHQHLL